jgi:hypothetical protein
MKRRLAPTAADRPAAPRSRDLGMRSVLRAWRRGVGAEEGEGWTRVMLVLAVYHVQRLAHSDSTPPCNESPWGAEVAVAIATEASPQAEEGRIEIEAAGAAGAAEAAEGEAVAGTAVGAEEVAGGHRRRTMSRNVRPSTCPSPTNGELSPRPPNLIHRRCVVGPLSWAMACTWVGCMYVRRPIRSGDAAGPPLPQEHCHKSWFPLAADDSPCRQHG